MPQPTPIEWTEQARLDLLDVVLYLRERRPTAASNFLDQVEQRLKTIALFPESGRPIPEEVVAGPGRESSHREVIVMRWRVGYSVSDPIEILYVVDCARRFPPLR